MLAHFLKSSHLLQIEEKGIEQFTGESIGISAISDELWTVFKVDFRIVLQKKWQLSLCYLHISVCDVHHCSTSLHTTLLIVAWLICLVGRVSLEGSTGWKLKVYPMAVGKSSSRIKSRYKIHCFSLNFNFLP